MSIVLGEAIAIIDLDIGGLVSKSAKAASAFRDLNAAGENAFKDVQKAIDALEGSLGKAGKFKLNLDMSEAAGEIGKLQTELDGLGSSIEGATGAKLTIDTSDAIGDLAAVRVEAEDVANAVAASGGMQLDIDTSAAIAGLSQVQSTAQDVAATVSAAGGVVFGLDVSEAISGLAQVRTEAQDAIATITAAGGAHFDVNTSQAIASLTQLATATDDVMAQLAAADNATIAISVTRDQLDAASRAVLELRQAVGQNMTATVSIGGLGELEAATTQAVRTREAIGDIADAAPSISLGNLNGELDQATASAEQLVSSLQGLGRIGIGGGLASLFIAPLVQGVKVAADLEQSLKNVEVALGNVSKSDLSKLDREIRDLGSATEFSAKEIAQVAEALAKAGYDVSDMIDGRMLPAVANLASATGADLNTAVRGVVQAMALWSPAIVDASIAMTDASQAADILTIAANSSSADIEDIIAGMRSLGPVVAQMGVSFDEAAAAIAVFTNYGMSGADAGISLARGLQNLNDPTSEAAQLMQQLGIEVFDAQGKFVGLTTLLDSLSTALSGVSDKAQFDAINMLFGAEAADAYAIAIASGVQPLEAIVAAMQEHGAAAEQAAAKTDTLSGAWQRLSESTGTALGGLAGGFVGPLTGLATVIDTLVSAFSALPNAIQQPLGFLVGFVGSLMAATTVFNLARGALALLGTSFTQVSGIAAFIAKLKELTSVLGLSRFGITGLVGSLGPLGIIVAAVGGSLLLMHNSMKKDKEAADALKASMQELADAIEMVRRRGDTALAGMAEGLGKDLAGLPGEVQQIQQEILATVGDPVLWRDKRFNELVAQGMAPGDAVNQAMKDWQALIPGIVVGSDKIEAANKKIVEALNDPNIDASRFIGWAQGLIDSAKAIEDPTKRAIALADAIDQINAKPLSDFSTALDKTGQSAKTATEFLGQHGLAKSLSDTNTLLDDAASKARDVSDAYAELYRMENGKYPDNNDQRRLNDILAERERIAKDLKAAIADGSDPELITTLTGELEHANSEAEELERILTQIAALAGMSEVQGILDSGFSNVDDRNANRARERNFWSSMVLGDAGNAAASANERVAQTAAEATERILAFGDATVSAAANAAQFAAQAVEMAGKARDMLDTFHEMRGVDNFLGDWNLTSYATDASRLAENIQTTGAAIENTTRVVIGNTNAIEQQISGLNDWATELIGVRGEYSALDDLLAANRIDSGQYEAAQNAQEQIRAGYESIKTSVQDIQATAAPILGDLVEKQAAYLESVAALPAEQQLVALAWMDSATSAKAYELYTQAAAVANGEFGESGKAMFTQMITGAAQADPALKALLLNMGLISEGADGEITVNFDQAEGATSEIKELTKSIDALIVVLGGVPPLHVDPGNLPEVKATVDAVTGAAGNAIGAMNGMRGAADEAGGGVSTLNDRLVALGNQRAEPKVDVQTGDAETQIKSLRDLLDPLDGKSIETRVKVLLDDETGGGDMSKYDQQGGGRVVHLKSVIDPPEGLPDYSGVPPVKVKTEYDALPPLDVPTPDPVIVPVQFNVDTAGGFGPSKVPGGMESALGGGAGGSGITIDVAVTVTGTEQLNAVKATIDSLNGKPVTVTATVSGAETIGALKLDVQNLSNKTVTVMATVTGAETLSTLKETLAALENKTVTLTISGDAASAGEAYTLISTLPDVTKWLFLFGDNGGAMESWQAVQNLGDATKWLFLFGDNGDAMEAWQAVQNLSDVTKTLTINVVTNGTIPALAKGGYVPGVGPNAVVARLAERGPEAFRTPSGDWGMALKDGLYPMIPGTRVYTAAQSRRMRRFWQGQAYASGGVVRPETPTRAAQQRSGTFITVNNRVDRVQTDIYPQTAEVSDEQVLSISGAIGRAVVNGLDVHEMRNGGDA